MIKYRTRVFFGDPEPKIKPIEVERETPKSVVIGGRRCGKETEYEQYHDSWEKAHEFLTKTARKRRSIAQKNFDLAMKKISKIRCMRPDITSGKEI